MSKWILCQDGMIAVPEVELDRIFIKPPVETGDEDFGWHICGRSDVGALINISTLGKFESEEGAKFALGVLLESLAECDGVYYAKVIDNDAAEESRRPVL